MGLNLKFLNGFGGLTRKILIKLTQLTPLYVLIFIAYGDSFLPPPLSNASYVTRTKIYSILTNVAPEDTLKNDKYNNKQIEKVIKETENQSK